LLLLLLVCLLLLLLAMRALYSVMNTYDVCIHRCVRASRASRAAGCRSSNRCR
jgi:hypothetical protein